MIQIVPANRKFTFRNNWLEARWHFSFGHYIDERNLGWGPLRVFNDDIVQPGNGFPMHRHEEMEIVTYVLEGEVSHADSSGGKGVLGAGEVQRMSAGRGIRHSEFNRGSVPVHLLQIWIEPATPGVDPAYDQKPAEVTPGEFTAIASGAPHDRALAIHQDATIFVGLFKAGQTVNQEIALGRRAYLFVIDGAITLNGEKLERGDQARIEDEAKLVLASSSDSHVMLIDLP
jgi:redox-sensitive bicupin YhaK (pirin superfamily)